MYKVFYNNSRIEVGESLIKNDSNLQVVQLLNKTELSKFLSNFLSGEKSADYYLFGYAVDGMFNDLMAFFNLMEAAGGLVVNPQQEYLFIRRFGIWDLPKGKMKINEVPEEAAIREVDEETGIGGLHIRKKLSATYHIYPYKDAFVLKKTYWYLMFSEDNGKLIPQLEEDITEAVWLDKKNSRMAIASSYRSLSEHFIGFFQE